MGLMKELRARTKRASPSEVEQARLAVLRPFREAWLDRRRGIVLLIEAGPNGWLCPAWWQDGRYCAVYQDTVFVWNQETESFEKAKGIVPPWERDHRKERFDG